MTRGLGDELARRRGVTGALACPRLGPQERGLLDSARQLGACATHLGQLAPALEVREELVERAPRVSIAGSPRDDRAVDLDRLIQSTVIAIELACRAQRRACTIVLCQLRDSFEALGRLGPRAGAAIQPREPIVMRELAGRERDHGLHRPDRIECLIEVLVHIRELLVERDRDLRSPFHRACLVGEQERERLPQALLRGERAQPAPDLGISGRLPHGRDARAQGLHGIVLAEIVDVCEFCEVREVERLDRLGRLRGRQPRPRARAGIIGGGGRWPQEASGRVRLGFASDVGHRVAHIKQGAHHRTTTRIQGPPTAPRPIGLESVHTPGCDRGLWPIRRVWGKLSRCACPDAARSSESPLHWRGERHRLMSHPHAFHPLDPRTAHQRVLWAAVLGAITWLAAPAELSLATRALLTWDIAGLALLAIVAWIIIRADPAETRRRAAAHDPGRTVVWLLVLGASALSLFAAIIMIRQTKTLPPIESRVLLGLSVAAVALAWLLSHAGFALRYAHLFYRGGLTDEGGLEIPGGESPDDLDFAYFAFTIGMCFQVSDVTITSRVVRRTVLAHAMLSFAYNTGILALAINVVIAQLG